MNPNAKIFIVMGKTESRAPLAHRQQSMILVPRDTPGPATILRGMTVFGLRRQRPTAVTPSSSSADVRVPVGQPHRQRGRRASRIAQARSGPRPHPPLHALHRRGRTRHRARCAQRAAQRVAFGRPLRRAGRHPRLDRRVAGRKSEQLRLLVLKAAWLMDTVGNQNAHTEIQAIKIATPKTVEWILDKAIQTRGAGVAQPRLPLAQWFAEIRNLRFADGPDEVHKASLARKEIDDSAPAARGRCDTCAAGAHQLADGVLRTVEPGVFPGSCGPGAPDRTARHRRRV
mgnify:CR=1 FL=1